MTRQEACKLLDITPPANADDVKKAYRIAAKKHHPDVGGDAEKFKQINTAFELIKAGVGNIGTGSGPIDFKTGPQVYRRREGESFQERMMRELFKQYAKESDKWYGKDANRYYSGTNKDEPKYHDFITIKMNDWVHGREVRSKNGIWLRFPKNWRYGANIKSSHPTIPNEKILFTVKLEDNRYGVMLNDISIKGIKYTIIDKIIGYHEYIDPVFGFIKFKISSYGLSEAKKVMIGEQEYTLYAHHDLIDKPIPPMILEKLKALNEELKNPVCEF